MGKELHKIFYLNIIQPVTRDKENLRWGEGVQCLLLLEIVSNGRTGPKERETITDSTQSFPP